MKGSPAKMGMIKGTAGHSSALKQKKEIDRVEETRKAEEKREKREKRRKEIEDQMRNPFNPHERKYDPNKKHPTFENSPAKQLDPKVREALESFDRPTPATTTLSKEQVKKILEKMKSVKGPGVQLSDDHKKTIEGIEKMIKNQKSPAKQEGPISEKNPDLMKGEMEGTYVYEGKDNTERIIDLEERAGFLTDNDIPDLEDSKDPKDIKRVKQLRATVKKLQHEADILRNRKPNKK